MMFKKRLLPAAGFLLLGGGLLAQQEGDGFQKLGPPKPGEWRAQFREPAQSYEKYIAGAVNRKSDERTTFYLQPLGNAGTAYREMLERMRLYAEAFFGVPAKVLEPIPLPDDALEAKRSQYNATKIIGHLADRLPKDALVYIGIAEKDLTSEGLNFVFGEASLEARTGLCSLARLEGSDRRALKLMTHEAGHILSIAHCTAWRCVMQGSNTLKESDGHPLHLCPDDLRKLEWNTGVDPVSRYRALAALYSRWKWQEDAGWADERIANRESRAERSPRHSPGGRQEGERLFRDSRFPIRDSK